METRFLADSMLGRLAKWLRVMGCDAHYQPCYRNEALGELVGEGRILLSRKRKTADAHGGSLFLLSERVGEQLQQMREAGYLRTDEARWFTRCLICNVPVVAATRVEPGGEVPEYVFYENRYNIRACPSCGRYFWPGSHRERMKRQLKEWGM